MLTTVLLAYWDFVGSALETSCGFVHEDGTSVPKVPAVINRTFKLGILTFSNKCQTLWSEVIYALLPHFSNFQSAPCSFIRLFTYVPVYLFISHAPEEVL